MNMTTAARERCWLSHRRRPEFNSCPLCGAPIKWERLWDGTFSPCDAEPVLVIQKRGSRFNVVYRRELIKDCKLYSPRTDGCAAPKIARMPHYYTCPVLKAERREWARKNLY